MHYQRFGNVRPDQLSDRLYFPVTRKGIQDNKAKLDIEDLFGNDEPILVVDDVEAQRKIATSILTQMGYALSSVASGEEALVYLKDNSVDLLVLDMIMPPGINGLATYRRALEIAPAQKAIITSGYSESESVKQAQASLSIFGVSGLPKLQSKLK